ncbi:MAG: hypothetical protein AB8B53_03050 [Flavobacteriales bacterium]
MSAVDNFILDQEEPQRGLLMILNDLLMNHSGVNSAIKWGIPVYETTKYFCYITPVKKTSYVEICFKDGKLLFDPKQLLEFQNRKLFKGVMISVLNDELLEDIDDLISESISLIK